MNHLIQNISKYNSKWKISNFKEVFKDASGGNKKLKKKDYLESGDFPIVDQGKNLIGGYTNDVETLCKSDVPLIIFGDHTRIIKYIDFKFTMGADGVKVLCLKKKNHIKYLYYFLTSLNIPNTGYNRHFKYLKDVKIPLPPLPIQQQIATVLDAADALRRTTAEQLQQLDKLAESVFLEMFGDSYLNTKDWEVKFLKDITTHIIDCPHSTPKYVDYKSDYPCIRTTELKKGLIDWSSMKYLDEEGHIKRVRRLEPTFGDIIYGREGSFGEAAIVPKNVNISLGQRVVLFRPNYELVNSSYLLALLRSSGLYQQALRKTSGSTVGHINIKDIKKYSCMIPPLKLQNEFAKIIANIEEQKAVLKESLRDSEDMFNGLLQEVFS